MKRSKEIKRGRVYIIRLVVFADLAASAISVTIALILFCTWNAYVNSDSKVSKDVDNEIIHFQDNKN